MLIVRRRIVHGRCGRNVIRFLPELPRRQLLPRRRRQHYKWGWELQWWLPVGRLRLPKRHRALRS